MYPKAEEGAPLRGQAPPPATGFPMSGGGGGYYQAGGATAAALAVQAHQAPVAAWSTGLCDCFDDCSNCGGDHRPGVDVVRHQRGALRAHHAAHRLPVRLLLLLPRQDARPVRPPGEPLRRLLRPLLLRVLRPLPGVPRAQEERLRHEARMACQHGEAGAHRRHHAAADAPGDDPLMNDDAAARSIAPAADTKMEVAAMPDLLHGCIYPSSARLCNYAKAYYHSNELVM